MHSLIAIAIQQTHAQSIVWVWIFIAGAGLLSLLVMFGSLYRPKKPEGIIALLQDVSPQQREENDRWIAYERQQAARQRELARIRKERFRARRAS